jgi:hypothetical protein
VELVFMNILQSSLNIMDITDEIYRIYNEDFFSWFVLTQKKKNLFIIFFIFFLGM